MCIGLMKRITALIIGVALATGAHHSTGQDAIGPSGEATHPPSLATSTSSGSSLWLAPGTAADQPVPGRVAQPLSHQPQLESLGGVSGYVVRVAYVIPTNRTEQADGVTKLRYAIGQYQWWYRDQMERNGFGSKTFRFETEADGVTPKIYTIRVSDTDEYLRGDLWNRTLAEATKAGVPVWAPKQIWWLIPEAHVEAANGSVSGGTALGAGFG